MAKLFASMERQATQLEQGGQKVCTRPCGFKVSKLCCEGS